MDLFQILSIIALISSVFTPVAVFAYWKGKVDTKIDTLWDVYTASVLVRERQSHNPHPKAPIPLPDAVKAELDSIHHGTRIGDMGYSIVRRVSVVRIQEIALANKVGFGEVVANMVLLINKPGGQRN